MGVETIIWPAWAACGCKVRVCRHGLRPRLNVGSCLRCTESPQSSSLIYCAWFTSANYTLTLPCLNSINLQITHKLNTQETKHNSRSICSYDTWPENDLFLFIQLLNSQRAYTIYNRQNWYKSTVNSSAVWAAIKFSWNRPECRLDTSCWRATHSNWRSCTQESFQYLKSRLQE